MIKLKRYFLCNTMHQDEGMRVVVLLFLISMIYFIELSFQLVTRNEKLLYGTGSRVSCAGGGPSGSRALAKKSPPTWRKSPPISPPPAKFSPGGKIPPPSWVGQGGDGGGQPSKCHKMSGNCLIIIKSYTQLIK